MSCAIPVIPGTKVQQYGTADKLRLVCAMHLNLNLVSMRNDKCAAWCEKRITGWITTTAQDSIDRTGNFGKRGLGDLVQQCWYDTRYTSAGVQQ